MLDVAHEYLREKLAKEPTLLLMIVGIPNVGKSALINTLFRNAPTTSKLGAGLFFHSFASLHFTITNILGSCTFYPMVSYSLSCNHFLCVKTSKVGTFICYVHPPIVLLSKL